MQKKSRNTIPSLATPKPTIRAIDAHGARMSALTPQAGRTALLQMARAPLAYGRRVLSARAIEELAWRCFHRHVKKGCSLARCVRVESVVVGRRIQVIDLTAGLGPVETAAAFTGVLDAFSQLQSNAQAAVAAAAMDEII